MEALGEEGEKGSWRGAYGSLSNDLGRERAKGSVSNNYMIEEKFEGCLFEIRALLHEMLERSKGRIKGIQVIVI